jgi:hypothetical protein
LTEAVLSLKRARHYWSQNDENDFYFSFFITAAVIEPVVPTATRHWHTARLPTHP